MLSRALELAAHSCKLINPTMPLHNIISCADPSAEHHLLVQRLQGAVANGKALFVRGAMHMSGGGLVVAFAAGYAVYGALLLAATAALKWALVGRMQAGRHKCAASVNISMHVGSCNTGTLRTLGSGMRTQDGGRIYMLFFSKKGLLPTWRPHTVRFSDGF